jgi:LruC domain-containing protein
MACGGSGATTTPHFEDENQPGPAVNHGSFASVLEALQPYTFEPSGTSPNAPLGTNPAYNVAPASATISTRSSSRAASELGPGSTYGLLGVTMALKDVAPDWEATDLEFNEGDKVTLWMKYEAAANASFSRRWVIEEAGLDYLEPSVTAAVAGIYEAGFTINLPYDFVADDMGSKEAQFEAVIAAKIGSVIVGPEDAIDRVDFTVNNVDTDSTIIYPLYEQDAQMAWEDILQDATGQSPDYDYNDLVAKMHAKEYRNVDNELVQIDFTVKALARGAGWVSDWQFNMDGAFPGAHVVAIVDQFYANGSPHGAQRVWSSVNGASVPVFAPTIDALRKPADSSFSTNTTAGTTFVDGDYSNVRIILDTPLAQGSYTPIPYDPELRVSTTINSRRIVYSIPLWRERGDALDQNGRPLGFIVPDTYAWPLETKKIDTVYSGFAGWLNWIKYGGTPPEPAWFDRTPITNYFKRSLFK